MKYKKKSIKKSLNKSLLRTQIIEKTVQLRFQKFTEIVENFNIGDCLFGSSLNVKKLLSKLQKQCNFFFKDTLIRYYLQEGNVWLKCPITNSYISAQDFLDQKTLKFQISRDVSLLNIVMNQQQISQDDQQIQDDGDHDGKCRRLKQRKIKHVIQKVLKWRELYAGIVDGKQIQDKIPLEQGAIEVNISKKTLDDYLSQLKKGKKYGFNFNQHKNQKIGVLRQFIRKIERKNCNKN